MTEQLQQALNATRVLSTKDKIKLLAAVSKEIDQDTELEQLSERFYKNESLEEIAARSKATVVQDIRELAFPFWPDDETADDINRYVDEQRKGGRMCLCS